MNLSFAVPITTNDTYFITYLYINDDDIPLLTNKKYQKKYKYDVKSFEGWTFEKVVACINNLSDQNIFERTDKYKVSFELVGTYKGICFTLYDWKEDNCVHIGGTEDLDIDGLKKELIEVIKMTEPKPFKTRLYYTCEKYYSYPIM